MNVDRESRSSSQGSSRSVESGTSVDTVSFDPNTRKRKTNPEKRNGNAPKKSNTRKRGKAHQYKECRTAYAAVAKEINQRGGLFAYTYNRPFEKKKDKDFLCASYTPCLEIPFYC